MVKVRKIRNKDLYWIIDHKGKKLITHAVSLSQLRGGDFTWDEVLNSSIKEQFTNPQSVLRSKIIPAIQAIAMVAALLVPGAGEAVDAAVIAGEAAEVAETAAVAAEAVTTSTSVLSTLTEFASTAYNIGQTAANIGQTAYTAYQLAQVIQDGGSPLDITVATLGLASRVVGLPGVGKALSEAAAAGTVANTVLSNASAAIKAALQLATELQNVPGQANQLSGMIQSRFPTGLPTDATKAAHAILDSMVMADNKNNWLFGGFAEQRDPDGGPADFNLRYYSFIPKSLPYEVSMGEQTVPSSTPPKPSGPLNWVGGSSLLPSNNGYLSYDPNWINVYNSTIPELDDTAIALWKTYDLKKVILDIFKSYPSISSTELDDLNKNIAIARKNEAVRISAPSIIAKQANANSVLDNQAANQAIINKAVADKILADQAAHAKAIAAPTGGNIPLPIVNINNFPAPTPPYNDGTQIIPPSEGFPTNYTTIPFTDIAGYEWCIATIQPASGPFLTYGTPYDKLINILPMPHLTPYNVYYSIYPEAVTLINNIPSTLSDPDHDLAYRKLTIGTLWSPSGGSIQNAIDMNGILAYWYITQAGTFTELNGNAIDYLHSTEQIANSTAIVNLAIQIWPLTQQLALQEKIGSNAYECDKLLSTPLTIEQAGIIATGKSEDFYNATMADRNDKMLIYQQLDVTSHAEINNLNSQIHDLMITFNTLVKTSNDGWIKYMTNIYNGFVERGYTINGIPTQDSYICQGMHIFTMPYINSGLPHPTPNPIPYSTNTDDWSGFVLVAKHNTTEYFNHITTLKYNGPVEYYAGKYPIPELGQYSNEAFVGWLKNEVFYEGTNNIDFGGVAPSIDQLASYVTELIGDNAISCLSIFQRAQMKAFDNYITLLQSFPLKLDPTGEIISWFYPPAIGLPTDTTNLLAWILYYNNYASMKVTPGISNSVYTEDSNKSSNILDGTIKYEVGNTVADLTNFISTIPVSVSSNLAPTAESVQAAEDLKTAKEILAMSPTDQAFMLSYFNQPNQLAALALARAQLTGGFISRRTGIPAYMMIAHRMRHRV